MNSEHLFELDHVIESLEKEIDRYPGLGVTNYDMLRVLYLLKAILTECNQPPPSTSPDPEEKPTELP